MKSNIENMMKMFAKIRKYYAKKVHDGCFDEDLSLNEINILIVLSNNPGITKSSQLISVLDVSKGLVSRSIDHLVKLNILSLQPDLKDRRINHLCLTDKGKVLIVKLNAAMAKINEEILKDISLTELKQMEQTMKKIIERFEMEE